MTEPVDFNDSNFTFTRYLYSKIEVKQSLIISILNKNIDESLYWFYELYYSGFENEMAGLLNNIFVQFFLIDNPKYKNIIEEHLTTQTDDMNELNWGSVVITFCTLHYRIDNFVEMFYNVKCKPASVHQSKKRALFIQLKPEDIEPYKTMEITDPPRLYLEKVCRYPIHKSLNSLFNLVGQDFNSIYKDMEKWIYYACRSPVWKARVKQHGGFVIDPLKRVVFLNEQGELDEDIEGAFWDVWNLETDEQLPSVTQKSIGTNKEEQWSVIDFCKKYGAEPVE